MAGESMCAIAASENLSLRRVQQVVRYELDRLPQERQPHPSQQLLSPDD
jgi:hypothetical protein